MAAGIASPNSMRDALTPAVPSVNFLDFMQPPPTGKNIDEYLNYFVSRLGRGLTDDGREALRSILFDGRGHPRSLFLYFDERKSALVTFDPELEEVLTNFWGLFC
jgi:hypothetical protein